MATPLIFIRYPPVEVANHYLEYMGGADTVVGKARDSFEAGEY